MTTLLCKLWNFFLNMFTDVVETVTKAAVTVSNALIDIVGSLVTSVGTGLFKSPLGWGLLALGGLYILGLTKDDDRGGGGTVPQQMVDYPTTGVPDQEGGVDEIT